MTLPDERYRAVIQTKRFLIDLTNPQHTPRVSKIVRQTARAMLRHYPNEWDMQQAAKDCPDLFQERMEPVNRWVQAGAQEKQNEA